MDIAVLSPFPPIPVELVYEIMETAVLMEEQTALSLALVSRDVNHWITPMIYHSVVLNHLPSGLGSFDAFIRILCTPHANATLGANVRRLILMNIKWDATLLFGCPNLETLMTDEVLSLSPHLDSSSEWPVPARVMLVSKIRYQARDFLHPVLRNVTHLYVDYPDSGFPELIALLPYLTHLGVACWGEETCFSIVSHALSQPSMSTVLVQAFHKNDGGPVSKLVGHPWVELAEIEDERLIAGPGISDDLHSALVTSGRNIWEDAAARHRDWRELVTVNDN